MGYYDQVHEPDILVGTVLELLESINNLRNEAVWLPGQFECVYYNFAAI